MYVHVNQRESEYERDRMREHARERERERTRYRAREGDLVLERAEVDDADKVLFVDSLAVERRQQPVGR